MVMEEQQSDMELASESIPVPQVQEPIIDAIKRNKSGASRKPRLRKKALYASILKQMEFYFSDANLSKDRYLSGLLKNNPYVDLSEFVRFNKLSELTTDINRIAKALQESTMLKISEDGTKVCRTTPIKKKENVDECTVYVQNLPPDADHEWLESIFSKYGRVDYISIPRYKNNRKIKGFAFIEFDAPTSAQKCIKIFREKGCVLPSYTSPNDLLSITTFDDPKKDHTVVRRIDENAEMKLNDNDKETDKTENNDDNSEMDTADNNDELRKRKVPAGKLFVEEKSDVIVKKKRKDGANQNVDQENEKEAALKDEIKDSDDIHDNEKNNSSKQNLKKRKLTSGKSVTETEDNDNSYNNEKDNKQNLRQKKGKSIAEIENNDNSEYSEKNTVDNSKNLRKKKLTSGKSVTETEDNDHTNEKDKMDDNKQNLRKKKLASDKSMTEVNNTANSNVEIEESSNKDIANNKSPERKKRRLTINDTVEDINKEMTKKDSHVLATKSSKSKGKESEYPNKSDGEHESDAALQTEKHSVMKDVEMKSDVEEKELDGNERKKKKNRKKRSKIEEDFDDAIVLQVMAKPEWKHLRNRYLDLQRTKMSQLKQHLRKAKVERGEMMRNRWNYDKVGPNYDKSKHEKDNEKINEAESLTSGRVSYVPGIIVKIEMDEPCTDPQSFKMELRDNNSIKYIDITHGSCEAYVRCDTSEAAQLFAQKNCEGRRLMVLKDDEEKLYWDKIIQDRAEKLNRKDKKQRGRNKLLKRAEKQLGKCIKFDQD